MSTDNLNADLVRGSIQLMIARGVLEDRSHSLVAIQEGIRKFHKEHEKIPSQKSGTATAYVGYRATWSAVDQWLRKTEHSSLPQLCKDMGFDSHFSLHSLKAIQKGIRKFYKEHGKVPVRRSGEAEPYVGYKTTWEAVNFWLRKDEHGSLLQLCKKMGFESLLAPHSLKATKSGIRKYRKEHGDTPSQRSGDAEPYVGYKTTWMNVNDWLRNRDSSLSQLSKEMGFDSRYAEHRIKAVQRGIRKYHKEQGKNPGVKAGEAEPYLGYKTTWMNVDAWLRRNGYDSLSQLCKKMKLPKGSRRTTK